VTMKRSPLSRRAFVGALPLTVLLDPSRLAADVAAPEAGPFPSGPDPCQAGCPGACLGSPQEAPSPFAQEGPKPGFNAPFTPEEAEKIAASPMAREIAALMGRGLSCAEMSLLAALRALALPESHLGAAGVFGGGVGKGDLCGFLTGSLMAFGLAASERYPGPGRDETGGPGPLQRVLGLVAFPGRPPLRQPEAHLRGLGRIPAHGPAHRAEGRGGPAGLGSLSCQPLQDPRFILPGRRQRHLPTNLVGEPL
jgi:hypothetical protein